MYDKNYNTKGKRKKKPNKKHYQQRNKHMDIYIFERTALLQKADHNTTMKTMMT
jgi:hypothetical protein